MPATITATGPLSIPFRRLAQLLAECTTFQTAVSAADADEALDKIDYPYRDVEQDGWLVPGAVITDQDFLTHEQQKNRLGSGALLLSISLPVNEEYEGNPTDQLLDYRNTVGAILTEILSKSNTPAADGTHHLNAIRYRKVQTPARSDPDDFEVDFFGSSFAIDWQS